MLYEVITVDGGTGSEPGRYLLGDAVDVATAQQDLARRHAHHLVLGENLGQDRPGLVVGRRVQQRKDDAAIGDEKIHVGGGQPFPSYNFV